MKLFVSKRRNRANLTNKYSEIQQLTAKSQLQLAGVALHLCNGLTMHGRSVLPTSGSFTQAEINRLCFKCVGGERTVPASRVPLVTAVEASSLPRESDTHSVASPQVIHSFLIRSRRITYIDSNISDEDTLVSCLNIIRIAVVQRK